MVAFGQELIMARDNYYDRFKKNKSPKLKKFRRRTEYYFVLIIIFFASLWPVRINQFFGAFLGRLAYYLMPKDRGIGLYQLGFCFPELTERERQSTLKKSFQSLGQSLFEMLCIKKIRKNPDKWIKMSNENVLLNAYQEGKGVILLFGHVGNWELIPTMNDMLEIPGIAIGSPLDDEKLDELLINCRKTKQMRMIPRKGNIPTKAILNCFRNNELISLSIDQDTRVKSVFCDFFGKKAATPIGPVTFGQKFGAPVISAFGARMKDGTHYCRFELLSKAPYQGGKEEIEKLTQVYTTAFEKHIRQYPDQWAWFHRRWKTQPSE